MIIIDRNEFSKKTSPSNIERYITNDIFSKKEIIKTTVVKTINDFLIMKDKMTKGLDLNENERFLSQRTTLVNFEKELKDIIEKKTSK